MKHLNWLVKLLFYKNTEKDATKTNTANDPNSVFYGIGYIDQQHANLCTAASEQRRSRNLAVNKSPVTLRIPRIKRGK